MTFESRFNKFRQKFEAGFNLNLQELSDSGIFQMVIDMPLYEDVKNEMVKLLKNKGFNESAPFNLNNVFDFSFENKNNKTFFCILKYIKIFPLIYQSHPIKS